MAKKRRAERDQLQRDRYREYDRQRRGRIKADPAALERKRAGDRKNWARKAAGPRKKRRPLSDGGRLTKKVWVANNPERVRAYQRKANAKRRSTPEGKINGRVSARIWQCLRATAGKKSRRWEILVGFSVSDLKRHLERQFVDGMNWENMGLWHIDHIIPLSKFRYETPDQPEFSAAWALTNLRPAWAVDNIKKHSKRTFLL